MTPVTSLNGWIMAKIVQWLTSKEGVEASALEYTADGARVVLQDAFGFRYEVSIKTLSRVNNSIPEGVDRYDGISTRRDLCSVDEGRTYNRNVGTKSRKA